MKRFDVRLVVPAVIVCGAVSFGLFFLYQRTQNLGLAVIGSVVGGAVLVACLRYLGKIFDSSELEKIRRTGIMGVWPNWQAFDSDSGISIFDRIEKTKNSMYFVGVSLEYTANQFYQCLKDAILRGVSVRLLLLDPDCRYAQAHDEVVRRSFRKLARESIAIFQQLRQELPPEARDRFSVLKSKYLPRVSVKIFDDKTMLVNLYLYDSPAQRNPIFEVDNSKGEIYFSIKRSIDKMAEGAVNALAE